MVNNGESPLNLPFLFYHLFVGGFDAKVLPKPDIITAYHGHKMCVLVAWRSERRSFETIRAEARARSPREPWVLACIVGL